MTSLATSLATLLAESATSSSANALVLLLGIAILLLLFWYCATEKKLRKRNIGSVIIVVIAIASLFSIISPSNFGKVLSGEKKFTEATNFSGGIDIVGGTSIIMEVQQNEDEEGNLIPLDPRALAAARDTLAERIDKSGGLNAIINILPPNRIEIQIPHIEPARAKEVIKKLTTAAKLTIHSVHPRNGDRAYTEQVFLGKEIAPGYKAFPEFRKDKEGNIIETVYHLVRRKPGLTGKSVEQAWPNVQEPGVVNIKLTRDGANKMINFTKGLKVGDLIVTILDGRVVNAASLRQETLGRQFQISGLDSAEECKELSEALLNPLENEVRVMGQQTVSATLGAATVSQGINAGLAGLGLTLLFVLLYYRYSGIIAIAGLLLNGLILFGAMAAFGAAFTLPGIAGIILTIGVAVDANVLIYERLREELALGKSVKAAIKAAYDKAFTTIVDANITTLITAVILFWQAAGSIRGFAVTLIIGILGTLLSSLLCTRVLFWWSSDLNILKNIKFMSIIPKRSIDFLSMRKIAFIVSGILIIGGISMVGMKGSKNLGVDFTGGNILRFEIPADQTITHGQVEAALKDLKLEKAQTSQIEDPSNLGVGNENSYITIKCGERSPDSTATTAPDRELITQRIQDTFHLSADPSVDVVSSALGDEFLKKAIWALVLGLFCVLIYITIRFEFSFAVGAFIALIHDVLITLGLLFILDQELSLIHISAFLTLVGYSINDTIVVFDRIREKLRTKRGDVKEIMNAAISGTLSRTVLTSLTTFVAVLVLYIYGGSSLQDFSLTIMISVIVGTYSSIFIASPVVYLFSKMRKTNLRRELLDADLEAQITPDLERERGLPTE